MNTYIMRALNTLERSPYIGEIIIPYTPTIKMWVTRDEEHPIREKLVNKAKVLLENCPFDIIEMVISADEGITVLVMPNLQELLRHNVEAEFSPNEKGRYTCIKWEKYDIKYRMFHYWDRA